MGLKRRNVSTVEQLDWSAGNVAWDLQASLSGALFSGGFLKKAQLRCVNQAASILELPSLTTPVRNFTLPIFCSEFHSSLQVFQFFQKTNSFGIITNTE